MFLEIKKSTFSLTAAHCVKKIPPTWLLESVRLGEWNLDTEIDCSTSDDSFCAPKFTVNKVVNATHYEHYRQASRDQHFDIALLRLAKKIEFNEFVKPICLPLDPALWNKDYSNQTFDAAGEKRNRFYP